eukprot:1193011-Prorocentrum_minimum.AAC.2
MQTTLACMPLLSAMMLCDGVQGTLSGEAPVEPEVEGQQQGFAAAQHGASLYGPVWMSWGLLPHKSA